MPNKPFTFALLADTHYYSPQLGTDGKAYRLRSESDQKCLAGSGDVLREAFAQIGRSGADAVLLAGDLTCNGEMCSHAELRELLRDLRRHVPVYVVTATHDWCSDGRNARYDGDTVRRDVPTMPPDALADYYREFGLSEAMDTFPTPTGVSCTVPLRNDLRLLLLNDDQNGQGRSGYTAAHLQWIARQIRQAHADGAQILAAAHHPLLPPVHDCLTGSSCIGDRESVAAFLADAGLRCIVTGHLHMQELLRTVSPAGHPLTEISVGALCGWPGQIVYAAVTPERITLRTEPVAGVGTVLRDQTFGVLTHVLDAAKVGFAAYKTRIRALYLPKPVCLLYPFVNKWAKRFDTWTTAQSYAALRRWLPLLPKLSLETVGSQPLRDTVQRVFLSIFGDGLSLDDDAELYALVMAFFALPSRVLPHGRRVRALRESGENLLRKRPLDGAVVHWSDEKERDA